MLHGRRVVVTGLGLVSPLGVGVNKSWQRILKGESSTTTLKQDHLVEGADCRVASYVPQAEIDEILSRGDIKIANQKNVSRATLFGLVATHEALVDAKLISTDHDTKDRQQVETNKSQEAAWNSGCGIAVGQGIIDMADVHDIGNTLDDPKRGYKKINPHFITRTLTNITAGNISIKYKLTGPNHSVSTACTTGVHSIGDAFNFIRQGYAPMMVCGSTEASINKLTVAGFSRIRALCSKFNAEPQRASRPFDVDRCGFVMGEGAGIIILEDLENARARHADKIYAELLGYGLSGDAHHLTAPSPDGSGAYSSMVSALRSANIEVKNGEKEPVISHINAHATSTPLGDDIECDAIQRLFAHQAHSQQLTITSCKGSLGHLLGAAGSAETVFAILSCYHGQLIPCANLERPLEHQLTGNLLRTQTKWATTSGLRVLLKNSFGFGGTNASLVISNYADHQRG